MSIRSNGLVALVSSDGPEQSISSVAATSPIRARYVTVRDEASDEREAFVRSVFGDVACFPFSDEGTFALSRAGTHYDILIVDVSDPLRMARYLRVNRALLRNVAKFAMMQESSPPRRARMLVAGCDDVLDGARMSPEEARMRVAAVMRRRHAHWTAWSPDQRVAADLAQFAA